MSDSNAPSQPATSPPLAPASSPASSPAAVLPRELSEFLLQFSIALHRFGIYPARHPALAPLNRNVRERLEVLLGSRGQITLGVAQSQLIIEGAATERRNPVLLDLARRLHAHQIGAISFARGIDEPSLQWVFETLSANPEHGGIPEGLRPPEERPPLRGIVLHPLGYDLLGFEAGTPTEWTPEPNRATSLWLGLAQAAMRAVAESEGAPGELRAGGAPSGASRAGEGDESASGEGATGKRASDEGEAGAAGKGQPPPDGAEVARNLARAHKASAYEQVIVGYLLQIAEELRRGTGVEVDGVRRRMVEMVRELDDDSLERILRMGGDTVRRHAFVLNASEAMNLDAVVKLLRAAAASSRQTVSASLTRVLTKLALHAEQGAEPVRERAAGAFRETVEELLLGWDPPLDPVSSPDAEGSPSRSGGPPPAGGGTEGGDPAGTPRSMEAPGARTALASERYALLLDTMAQAAPIFPASSGDGAEDEGLEGPDGALRMLQMALEVDAEGPGVERAVEALAAEGRILEVLGLADQVVAQSPEAPLAGRILRERSSSSELRRLLNHPGVPEGAVVDMARRVGDSALDDLLDALENSESRTVRRRAFDTLAGLGEVLARGLPPRIPDLSADPRWFVRRNLLALLRAWGELPRGFSPIPFVADPDPRVRRVAIQLAAGHPAFRDRALRAALDDVDPAVVRTAVLELQQGFPPGAALPLLQRILAEDAPEGLLPLGLRALRSLPVPPDAELRNRVAEGVADLLQGARSFLGRRRLPAPSPEVREAVTLLLAPGWREAPAARWIPAALVQARGRDPGWEALAREVETAAEGGHQ